MSSALATGGRRCAGHAIEGLRLGGCGWTCSGVPETVIDASRELGLVQLGHHAARYRVEFATR
jgi:hypothetical protein